MFFCAPKLAAGLMFAREKLPRPLSARKGTYICVRSSGGPSQKVLALRRRVERSPAKAGEKTSPPLIRPKGHSYLRP